MTVAVVERFEQQLMLDCPPGPKKLAFVGRWPLEEV